jgi:hypothetical protein
MASMEDYFNKNYNNFNNNDEDNPDNHDVFDYGDFDYDDFEKVFISFLCPYCDCELIITEATISVVSICCPSCGFIWKIIHLKDTEDYLILEMFRDEENPDDSE